MGTVNRMYRFHITMYPPQGFGEFDHLAEGIPHTSSDRNWCSWAPKYLAFGKAEGARDQLTLQTERMRGVRYLGLCLRDSCNIWSLK